MIRWLHIENRRLSVVCESLFNMRWVVWFTLREAHDEDDVNGDETQQVSHNHTVNHDYERADFFETSVFG